MELKQTITVSIKAEEVYFDLFEVESVEAGTVIRAKSKKFAAWLKTIQRPRAYAGGVDDVWINGKFKLPLVPVELDEGRLVASPSFPLFADGGVNMVWLFHGDLAEGWELLLPQPVSFNNLEDFFTSSIDNLRDLYIKYLRAGKLSATLSELVETP